MVRVILHLIVSVFYSVVFIVNLLCFPLWCIAITLLVIIAWAVMTMGIGIIAAIVIDVPAHMDAAIRKVRQDSTTES